MSQRIFLGGRNAILPFKLFSRLVNQPIPLICALPMLTGMLIVGRKNYEDVVAFQEVT